MVLLSTEIDESSVTLDAQSDLQVLQTGIRLVRALGPFDELEARIATLALEHLKKIRRLGGTSATLLLAAGEHPKIVSERLGHSSVMLTLDTYSHVLPDMQAQAAERMDKLLASSER